MFVQILMVYCRDMKTNNWTTESLFSYSWVRRYKMDDVQYSLNKKYPGLTGLMPVVNWGEEPQPHGASAIMLIELQLFLL